MLVQNLRISDLQHKEKTPHNTKTNKTTFFHNLTPTCLTAITAFPPDHLRNKNVSHSIHL